MTPFFSIITPTLERESLIECCKSVNSQIFTNWEHIVIADTVMPDIALMKKIEHSKRQLRYCGIFHQNYGNTCRHNAWQYATGKFLIMLDDDNTLWGNRVLQQIANCLATVKHWAIFPIDRHGSYFFNDPPGLCQSDTANVVVRREIGRWPDIPDYTADGIWIEALKAKYPYSAFPNVRPIIMMEKSNEGK